MRNETRFKFNAYLTQLANINGVPVGDVTAKFTVEPSVAQKLVDRVQESSGFLKLINMVIVPEQSGERLGMGIGGTIAGTTDTTVKDREAIDPTYIDGEEFKCTQTNFDTVLRYEKLDLWAKFQDFQKRIRNAIIQRQALDHIMIGFNGVKREKTSNREQFPLLQDVNIGWLEKIRQESPVHVISNVMDEEGNVISAIIEVGDGGTFNNLDALVYAAVNEKIAVQYQDDTELVVICGRALLADKYFPLINQSQPNTEKLAADLIISQKRIGGLPAVRAPFFPANALLITRLDNLSIYIQENTRRRSVIDNPKRDRVESFESVNEAFVVEDYDCTCLVENIKLLPGGEPEDKPVSDAEAERFALIAAKVVEAMKTAEAGS